VSSRIASIDLDEIIAAHSQAKQLLDNLSSLHKEVAGFNRIKEQLGRVMAVKHHEKAKESSPKIVADEEPKLLNNLIPFPVSARLTSQLHVTRQELAVAEKQQPKEPEEVTVEQTPLASHLSSPSDAPDSSAISFSPTLHDEVEEDSQASANLVPLEPEEPVAAEQEPAPQVERAPVFSESLTAEPMIEAPATVEMKLVEQGWDIPEERSVNLFQSPSSEPAQKITYSFQNSRPPRKRGDLDRKLRELIRDYGEVDIYSGFDTESKGRIVKKTMVASLVLVGVFLVFPGGASFSPNSQFSQAPTQDASRVTEARQPKADSRAALGATDLRDPAQGVKPAKAHRRQPQKSSDPDALTSPRPAPPSTER
jgi:hypothetical protein